MRHAVSVLLIVLFTTPLAAQQLPAPSTVIEDEGVRVPVYRGFEQLAPLFSHRSDTLRVINFWATWCTPCVKELPYFEELSREQRDQPLQVILLSLDMRGQLKSRLLPFLHERDIRSAVVVLDDPDANSWIDRVDSSWSGALPATLFLKDGYREFHEQSFTRHELHSIVTTILERP